MSIACSTSIRCGSSLETAVETIHRLGFNQMDLLVIDGWVHVNTRDLVDHWEDTIRRVEELCHKFTLQPIAINSGVGAQLHHRSQEINHRRLLETEALIRLMQHFNIQIAAIQPRNNDSSRPWKDVLKDCVQTLREQKALGDAAGVTFALEFHVNSPFETLEQICSFMEEMPEMPIVYDPSHFIMQGYELRETEGMLQRAAHVHIRDAAPGKLQTHFGLGSIDFAWMLGKLKERGYSGHFSIEYLESEEMDILEDVQKVRDCILQYGFL